MTPRVERAIKAYDDAAHAEAAIAVITRGHLAGRGEEMRRLRGVIRANHALVDDLFRGMTPGERQAFGSPIAPVHRGQWAGWAA